MRADVVVVGGGIVGLAIAKSLLERKPKQSVLLIEKETSSGCHASGRNSGVLHAGFYYAPDSLKARLTRDGNWKLRAFCDANGVTVRETGKVVVTAAGGQLPTLDELYRRGVANGVSLEMVSASDLSSIEPLARTFERALWSPTTAVASPTEVVDAMAREVTRLGGTIRYGTKVTSAGPGYVVTSPSDRIAYGHLVNAAGLYADRIAHWFGVGLDYRILPFKGLYWYGSSRARGLKRHVYPVPDPRNPFLGVHLTVTVDGGTKIGPTAIPALWREDYGGLHGAHAGEMADIIRTYPSFFKSREHDVLGLLKSEVPKYRRKHLVMQASELVPSVNAADYRTKGRVGVRAQLFHLPTRKLEMDFVVRNGERSTHILNAVSPAWTSALAFGEYVVDEAFGPRT